MNIADPSLCEWSPAPYLLFSENIWGNFIYYSHLFPSLTILIIATFIFWHNPKGKQAQALLFLALSFTAWSLIDLVLWASERSDLIMFFWSILIHFDLLIYMAAFYFMYTFINDSWPKWPIELLFTVLFVPLALFAHTSLNLTAFDFTNCWREALEGPLWQYYVYNAELVILLLIIGYSVYKISNEPLRKRKQEISLALVGIALFLASFSFGNITGSLETDWELGQYGLFGMPIFVVFLAFLMIRYEAFKAKILATEALIAGLGVLIVSLLFVQKIQDVQAIAIGTLILTTALGILLVRSVRKEVKQREEIEQLAVRLERANKRLKVLDKMKSEFVSIASHQLRSPLTSIRGYASMLLEGSYGTIPPKAKEALERISESSKYMVNSVEDYLNVSRIESGNMKYELSDFNLKYTVSDVVDELRQTAMQKGLLLTFRSDLSSKGIVHADVGKTRQALHNLINNSIKYTERGSVVVSVGENKAAKKLQVTVSDTGIGMSEDTLDALFAKFSRAKDANKTNISGTGLGLFVAKKMIEEMGGTITAKSDGPGKGSSFTLELPLQQ